MTATPLAPATAPSRKAVIYMPGNFTPIMVPNAWNPGQADANGQPTPASVQPTDGRPIYVQHHPWAPWMHQHGYRLTSSASIGQLNQSAAWAQYKSRADYVAAANAGTTPKWTSAGDPAVNPGDTSAAIAAMVRVSYRPDTFVAPADLWAYAPPLYFDGEIEATQPHLADPPDVRAAKLANIYAMVSQARALYDGRVWWYSGCPPYPIDAPLYPACSQVAWQHNTDGSMDLIVQCITDACMSFYNWSGHSMNRDKWRRDADNQLGAVRMRYPWLPIIAFISPRDFTTGKYSHADSILDPQTFYDQAEYLVDRGVGSLMCWYDPLDPVTKYDLTNTKLVECFLSLQALMRDKTPEPQPLLADLAIAHP